MRPRFLMFGIIAGFLAAFFLGAAWASGSQTQGEQPGAIKIGGAFALTGAGSALDLSAADGARLAEKEINRAGGVLGRRVELILRDGEYEPEPTRRIAKQFVEQDKVVAVIGFCDTDSVLAAGPIVQAGGLPFITVGATSPKLPQQIGNMMFMACFGDSVQAAAAAEYAFEHFGRTAYLLWDEEITFTSLLAGYFKARYTELGGKIVLEDRFNDAAADCTEQISRVKALPKQPDFYYLSAMPYNVGPLIKEFRKAGLTRPIIGGDSYDTPDLVAAAGPAANNVFFTTHVLLNAPEARQNVKHFVTSFRAEYGHNPDDAFAALGYDTMQLIADAIRRAGSTDSQAIKTALEGTRDFSGVAGAITLSSQSHVPLKPVAIVSVNDGKSTLAAEVKPKNVPAP